MPLCCDFFVGQNVGFLFHWKVAVMEVIFTNYKTQTRAKQEKIFVTLSQSLLRYDTKKRMSIHRTDFDEVHCVH